jgi:hypothetical protein
VKGKSRWVYTRSVVVSVLVAAGMATGVRVIALGELAGGLMVDTLAQIFSSGVPLLGIAPLLAALHRGACLA